MNSKNRFPTLPLIFGVVFSLLFLLLIVLLKTVDVSAIGPCGTSVGFSQINGAFRDWVGYNATLYKITKWLGVLALALAAATAVWSLVQLIRRKSLWKVDKLLLLLDCLYAVTGAFYLLFELVVVNCRPMLTAGESFPEASFPSSHTLLACVIFGGAFWMIAKYLRGWLKIAAWCASGVLLATLVLGRLFSGVHWLTDILGGLFLGAALLGWFAFLKSRMEAKEN